MNICRLPGYQAFKMNHVIVKIVLGTYLALQCLSVSAACVESTAWLQKLTTIKPEAIKLSSVQDCKNYIDVRMNAEAADISIFMKNIEYSEMGTPVLDAPAGDPSKAIHLRIDLDSDEE